MRNLRQRLRALAFVMPLLVLIIGVDAQAATPRNVQVRAKRVKSGKVDRLAFARPTTAGNLIVVYVAWSNPGRVALSDTQHNPYVRAQPARLWGTIGAWKSQVFYARNVAGGSNTVTARFRTSLRRFGRLVIHEYSGLRRTAPLDVAASRVGTSTGMNSGRARTTNSRDLIFGAGSSSHSIITSGSGFTARSHAFGSRTEDKTVSAIGSYHATATQIGAQWVMHLVAFKVARSDVAAPSVPSGLRATAVSGSKIDLRWTASRDDVGVAGYKVFRNGRQIGTSTTTSFHDSALKDGTPYSYTVSAYDRAGRNSRRSTAASARTDDVTAPSVPAHVMATAVSSTQTTVNWGASTDNVGVAGYRIYRDGTFLKVATVRPVLDSGLSPETTYHYRVTAIDAARNESARSVEATVTTPVRDTSPPSAAMTAPAPGSTVSGRSVTVSADASDNVGVADVDFMLDGVSIGKDRTAPYSIQWNTTTTSNGLHTLSARARDADGNLGVTSGVVTVTVDNPSAPPLPPGLVAAYNFSESTGTTTEDVTGNGNTAKLMNGALWTAGKYGSGIKLDGSDYLEISNSPSVNLSGGALTFSSWVDPAGGTGDEVLFAKGYSGSMTSPFYQYAVELRGGGLTPTLLIGTASGVKEASMGSALPQAQWSHFAVVFDGAHAVFYVNGAVVSTVALAASVVPRATPLRLGADAEPGQYLSGTLDDVRLYGRTLTQAEVEDDMSTPVPSPPGNGSPPSVSIVSPTSNAQLSNIVTITADASDDGGVAGVQFFVDGVAVGPEDTVAPYGAQWDTRAFANGAHTLTARARDVSGNRTVSNPVTVNVANTDSFRNEILATGFTLPVVAKFLPNGNLLVGELSGKIKVVPPPYTTPSPTLFNQLTVSPGGVQQGLYDLTLDPNFATNHYYYVFYTAETPDLGYDRLSRFTATADLAGTVPGSEKVLYQDPQHPGNEEHHGGGIAVSNDGHIFFTTGEGFNAPLSPDLTSPRGKLHRINLDGSVPTDNPFYDGAGPHVDSIWAYGLRNPFRAYYDGPTNRVLIGDVGGNVGTSNEEIELGARGANYGWPDFEGDCPAPCTSPLYTYEHNNRDAAVTGGFVYHGSQFPVGMQGDYFFGDYAQNWIKRLSFNPDGTVNGVFNFEPSDGKPDGPYGDIVSLTEGPDGALYYLDLGYSDMTGTFGVSKVRRISYIAANQPPVVVADASPRSGPPPLGVSFSSAGSKDPEGQPITYSWDFGDGSPLSTAANPTHTYTAAGTYSARLTVSDGVSTSVSTPIAIQAGTPPEVSISAPLDGSTFRAGDVIGYAGDATDAEDGALPASAFSWTVDFLHDGHVHPGSTVTGTKTGSFTIPTTGHDFEGNTRYRISLTVKDSDGLTTTKSVTVWPEKVDLTFSTAPAGLTVYVDGIARPTPATVDTLVGFNHTVEARDQTVGANNYTFASWSDGGAQTHTITVPAADQSYTATFTP